MSKEREPLSLRSVARASQWKEMPKVRAAPYLF